jgi:hypothetical protein
VNASRGVVERIGLLGGQDPAAMLASANGLFADGNLRDAAEAISGARGRLQGAQVNGLLRLLSLLLLIVVVGAAIVFLVRRQRRVPLRRGSATAADAPPERDLRGPAAD